MFIGHFAVALAAKKAAPKTSLAVLIAGAQLVDLIWPVMLLLGLEHVRIDIGNTVVTPLDFYDYPITHSLLGAVSWSLLFGGIYYFIKRLPREAVVLGLVVFSHWLLDLLSHRPDLPLTTSASTKFGLGLWNSFAGTMAVEFGMFGIGAYLYMAATKAADKTGTYALASLLIFLTAMHLGNLFGPPPPNVEMIAVAGNAMWLFVLWGWWIDKHRISRESATLI
ncbi:MAG: hypothetical protein WCW35_15640 [Bacteroidota bacterium]